MNCKNCNQLITRRKNANNVKFCSLACRNTFNRERNRTRVNQWQRNRWGAYAPDKIQCLICGKWYYKPAQHTYQTHHVDAYSYKKAHELDTTKGLITEETRELLRQHAKDNAPIVIDQNLIAKGKRTRFQRGDKTLGTYQRTPSQLARLREHGNKLPHNNNKSNHHPL